MSMNGGVDRADWRVHGWSRQWFHREFKNSSFLLAEPLLILLYLEVTSFSLDSRHFLVVIVQFHIGLLKFGKFLSQHGLLSDLLIHCGLQLGLHGRMGGRVEDCWQALRLAWYS